MAVPSILVVDDNPANRALARSSLEDEGYRVILAGSGQEALERFAEERPDCVLLDIRMPGTDGLEVCARIRALPGGSSVPVLFLTASREVDTFDKARLAGGDDFLTRPVRPTELVLRVEAALKLRRMDAELREQVELVKRQRDALLRLQLQKEQLTAFVVHDLKNPVNAIGLHAQLLERDGGLPEHARDSALRIRDEARGLLRLILNLLDISKAEEDDLRPRRSEVDLAALARRAIAELELRARGREVTLASQVGALTLSADGDLLGRVLENLIENAIRHAPRGSTVRVATTTTGDHVELRVVDAGPGVPPEMRQRIFERFVQVEVEEERADRAGRGLGLAFCKLVAQAHGGSVAVEDAHPGAAFVVRLPHGR